MLSRGALDWIDVMLQQFRMTEAHGLSQKKNNLVEFNTNTLTFGFDKN